MNETNEIIVKYQILDFINIPKDIGYVFMLNKIPVDIGTNL